MNPPKPTCTFYYGGVGVCEKGDSCQFNHDDTLQLPKEVETKAVSVNLLESLRAAVNGNHDAYEAFTTSFSDYRHRRISPEMFLSTVHVWKLSNLLPVVLQTLKHNYRSTFCDLSAAIEKFEEEKKNIRSKKEKEDKQEKTIVKREKNPVKITTVEKDKTTMKREKLDDYRRRLSFYGCEDDYDFSNNASSSGISVSTSTSTSRKKKPHTGALEIKEDLSKLSGPVSVKLPQFDFEVSKSVVKVDAKANTKKPAESSKPVDKSEAEPSTKKTEPEETKKKDAKKEKKKPVEAAELANKETELSVILGGGRKARRCTEP